MKKSISIVLVLAMLLTMLPLTVFSEESNDVTYTINMTFPTEVENGSTVAVGIAFFDIDKPEEDYSKPYVGRRLIFVKGETESITYTINKNMTWIMEGTYGNYYGLVNDEENYQRETDPNTAPSPVHLGNVDATNKVIELSIDTENCMAPGTYQMPEPPFTGKIANVIMNFPDSVPDGSYVDIALAYADKNKYEAWGGIGLNMQGRFCIL